MVAINYAKDIRVGEQPVKAAALGSYFVWPPLPERLFFRGQSLTYDFVRQRYGVRLPDDTIDYTTNINDLGIVTRASTATYWGPDGSLLEAAVDEARVQHDPVTGKALGLLVEGSGTNGLERSFSYFSGTLETANRTITLNAAPSPTDGVMAASVVGVEGAGHQNRSINMAVSMPPAEGVPYTSYAFVKSIGSDRIRFRHSVNSAEGTGGSRVEFYFRFESREITGYSIGRSSSTTRVFSAVDTTEAFAIPLVDEWWMIGVKDYRVAGEFTGGILKVYDYGAGDNLGFLVAGGQVERSHEPSSYIPTSGSPVTRAADNAVIDLSDVFNPVEGTLRVTAQVPEGEVVASLGDLEIVSDSDEQKDYRVTYSDYTGVPTVTLGNGIHSKLEYFPEAQP